MRTRYFLIFLGFILSFIGGFYFSRLTRSVAPPASATALREQVSNYDRINPLLACLQSENSAYEELDFLRKKIEGVANKAKQKGYIETSSVYFRDLVKGRWIGVNEGETYSPASLLKVPVAIAYFKQSEKSPKLLQMKFMYMKHQGNENPLITAPLLVSGNSYTAEELIRGMLVDSDNDAKDLLVGALDLDFLSEVYLDLGIQSPYTGTPQENDYHISTKTYALFFRVLYNATVLNREMSEKTLDLLSETKFPKGLKAGLPRDIPISHKYGVRVTDQGGKREIELSDCGIVYNQPNPYLICVMTKGTNPEVLASYIQDVGALVYEGMESGAAE